MSSLSPLHSHACCTVPPIEQKGYKEKGKFIEVDGVKTYVTGPEHSKRGIFVFYDIFGFYSQTLQGADILAYGDHEHPYKVFIPDFFDGVYAEQAWYPPSDDEKKEKLMGFLGGTASPDKHLPRVSKLLEKLEQGAAKGIKDWGVLGYCWGGKMVSLSSGSDTPFKAAAEAHPAMVDPEDAKKITIPTLLLPSMDESKDDCEAFKKALQPHGEIQYHQDQVHGFMAARADLEDEKVKKAYEQGYKAVLDFFHERV